MTLEEILDQAIAMLQRWGRLTYSTLKRQFQLNDAALDDLTNELIAGQCLAVDERGKREEAYTLLAPIYGWFTEGFDTADMQEAQALIEALS